MQKDIYLIQWYGPFTSKEDLKDWEDSTSQIFNLYIFHAIKNDDTHKYYCGMTIKQTVGVRMKNHDHHIHDFENEDTKKMEIWIGSIANVKPKRDNILLCENMITSELAKIGVGENNLENRINKKPPLNNVYIINEWWRENGDEVRRSTKHSIPYIMPEVLAFYSESKGLYGIHRLKWIGDL